MCTAMTVNTPSGDIFFGRTMDFSYPLNPELYYFPKGYRWQNILNTYSVQTKYSFMGIGQNISSVILADGVNEMGFAAAALYFPGYAQYDTIGSSSIKTPDIAAIEIVKFLLSTCASVSQAVSTLETIKIVGVKDAVTNAIAPLHWIIADSGGFCMVIEKTSNGLHCIHNPIGVLSNSPSFDWHMTNLRNYLSISPRQDQQKRWGTVELTPFGQGAGGFGLPGDYSPPSRFVRTAYQKSYTLFPSNSEEAVVACFHVMESVSIPKGVVITAQGTNDYTQYTAFIDLSSKKYYFKTYNNSCISAVKFRQFSKSGIISLRKLTNPIIFN